LSEVTKNKKNQRLFRRRKVRIDRPLYDQGKGQGGVASEVIGSCADDAKETAVDGFRRAVVYKGFEGISGTGKTAPPNLRIAT
jgi:hypothetical protein